MALQLGIQLASSQTNSYLTDAKYIRGGYLVVNSIAEIDERWYDEGSGGVLVEGSLCYDIEAEKFYKYSGADKSEGWEELEFATHGDDVTITLNSDNKLTLKGFSAAGNNQVPTKDSTGNLVWKDVTGLIPEAIVPVGDNATIDVSQDPSDNTKYIVSFRGKDAAATDAVLRKHITGSGSSQVVTYTWDTMYDKTQIDALLADKVDVEEGKGLSTNDYTDAEKAKLEGIEEGAEENVLEAVKVGGTALPITNKAVNITEISTDLFTQGENVLIFNCGGANQSNN